MSCSNHIFRYLEILENAKNIDEINNNIKSYHKKHRR